MSVKGVQRLKGNAGFGVGKNVIKVLNCSGSKSECKGSSGIEWSESRVEKYFLK